MKIDGGCHCGNLRYALDWPDEAGAPRARACGCSFCVKHGGRWTSHPDAALVATVRDPALLARYRFGTATADFHLCARCGVAPFVTSDIDGVRYAVVNTNTFETLDATAVPSVPARFDGEGEGERLDRRKRHWIARVLVRGG